MYMQHNYIQLYYHINIIIFPLIIHDALKSTIQPRLNTVYTIVCVLLYCQSQHNTCLSLTKGCAPDTISNIYQAFVSAAIYAHYRMASMHDTCSPIRPLGVHDEVYTCSHTVICRVLAYNMSVCSMYRTYNVMLFDQRTVNTSTKHEADTTILL